MPWFGPSNPDNKPQGHCSNRTRTPGQSDGGLRVCVCVNVPRLAERPRTGPICSSRSAQTDSDESNVIPQHRWRLLTVRNFRSAFIAHTDLVASHFVRGDKPPSSSAVCRPRLTSTPSAFAAVTRRKSRSGGVLHRLGGQCPTAKAMPFSSSNVPIDSASPAVFYRLISAVDTSIDVVYRSSDGA